METQFAFVNPPRITQLDACSQVLTVERQDAAGQPVVGANPRTVMLASTPSGVLFYATSACAGAQLTQVTIPAGAARTNFFGRASSEVRFTLEASAIGLITGAQAFAVVADPDSLVFIASPAAQIRGGSCLPATLEARRGTVAEDVEADTTISLGVTPAGGVRFYASTGCLGSTTNTLTLLAGQSSVSFSMKPLTGGASTVTATAPFGNDALALNVTPIVRRGTCSLSGVGGQCPVAPALNDLNQALLFTQATSAGADHSMMMARCRLLNTGAVECIRDGSTNSLSVHWQAAEIPQGLRVQRQWLTNCPSAVTLANAVDLSKTFVLKTLNSGTAGNYDDEDSLAARFTSTTQVSMQGPVNNCGGYALQVAEWDGVTVTRALPDGGMPAGTDTVLVSPVPPASPSSFLLTQGQTNASGALPMCGLGLRGSLSTTSELSVRRPLGNTCTNVPIDVLALERVDLGALGAVQTHTVTLADGELTRPVVIGRVDVTRTLVFSGTQMGNGQSAGTNDSTTAELKDLAAQFQLTADDTVQVTRASAVGTALFTFYVVELTP